MTDSHEPTPVSDEPSPAPSSQQDEHVPSPARRTTTHRPRRIEADLDAVQAALGRLADGSYWTDEVTGEPIDVDVLEADPLVRRA